MTQARILALMGSGETAPRLVKTHREILTKFTDPKVTLIATPYRFQENVSELSDKIIEFFRVSLLSEVIPADLPEKKDGPYDDVVPGLNDDLQYNRLLREADVIFSGPGSPSYALHRWESSLTKDLLKEKLQNGGALVFSSAAALTLGAYSIPVYEIYKVGQVPRWLTGLNVLEAIGLNAAIIPHYNNAEGGTHDTRFCYLGERRLTFLESQLPQDVSIIGIDEHTCFLIDLNESLVKVSGLGNVTVRHRGKSHIIKTGTTLEFEALLEAISELKAEGNEAGNSKGAAFHGESYPLKDIQRPDTKGSSVTDLQEKLGHLEKEFTRLVDEKDAEQLFPVLSEALNLLLDACITMDPLSDGDIKSGLEKLKSRYLLLVGDLIDHAKQGFIDKKALYSPLVEALIQMRNAARDANRYQEADRLRDVLVTVGIQIQDKADSTGWDFKD